MRFSVIHWSSVAYKKMGRFPFFISLLSSFLLPSRTCLALPCTCWPRSSFSSSAPLFYLFTLTASHSLPTSAFTLDYAIATSNQHRIFACTSDRWLSTIDPTAELHCLPIPSKGFIPSIMTSTQKIASIIVDCKSQEQLDQIIANNQRVIVLYYSYAMP